MENEKMVEAHLKKRIKQLNGLCYKFVCPGRKNVPDRVCLLPRMTFFVECKGTMGKVRPGQVREIKRMQSLGANVYIVSSRSDVDKLMDVLTEVISNEAQNL